MSFEKKILYVKGKDQKFDDLILETVKEYNLKTVVVGSNKGRSAIDLVEIVGDNAHVISITEFTYSDDLKKDMKKKKITPLEKVNLPIQDDRAMRETLLMFGSGVKAALEVARIAVINGLKDKQFITVAGGGQGLDTALLVTTNHPDEEMITDPKKRMLVKEIIALRKYD
ncbi:hypothetical protein GF319_10505 [Candidatus Bathyarchaeota archaeon]|nr:hypothetical protein [Candidatus Bathyarchaeota archaeon]